VTPLRIEAVLASPLCLHPDHGIGLDSLLVSATAVREQRSKAIRCADDLDPIEIPIALSPCGRYYMASFGSFHVRGHQARHIASPAPLMQYRQRSDATAIDMGAGADKSFRVPLPTVVAQRVTWWAVGDLAAVHSLVSRVPGLGRRHGAGMGEVVSWSVEEIDTPWSSFPALDQSGQPMRPVPLDEPGLGDHDIRSMRLLPPYWMTDGASRCAVRRGGWS
jgi:hypothetical protein